MDDPKVQKILTRSIANIKGLINSNESQIVKYFFLTRSDTRTVTPPTRWQTAPSSFLHQQQQQQQQQQQHHQPHQHQHQQMNQNNAESIINDKIFKPETEPETPAAGNKQHLPFLFVPNDHPQPKSPNLPGAGQAKCDRCGWNFDNESFLQVIGDHPLMML